MRKKTRQVYTFLVKNRKKHEGKRGIMVAHGETNLALMTCIEHISPSDFNEKARGYFMDNATLLHYIHQDGELWRRSIDPHQELISNWVRIR